MIPVLVTPPALEPVSLDEMKAWLRLDSTDDDALVATLIKAARLLVEASAGRLLIDQTWRIALDRWPAERILRLPLAPVSALTAIRVLDASGAPTSLPLGGFTLDTACDPPRLFIDPAAPAPGRLWSGIEIEVTAGYGPAATDPPEQLRQAIRLLVTRWFENRGDGPPPDAAAIPLSVSALLAPFRRARV